MKAVSFRKVEVTNPVSGEVLNKVRVVFDNGVDMDLLGRDMSTDQLIDYIKANRADVLTRIAVRTGQYGPFAVISNAKIEEEF